MTRFADIFSRKGAEAVPLAQARQPERQQRMAEALRLLLSMRADTDAPEAPARDTYLTPETALSPMVEVAATLWTRALRFDAAAPAWADRDRLIVSCRQQTHILRAVFELSGVEAADFTFGLPGLDTVFAPPGQALACAVGQALAERMIAARFGKSLCDHRVWMFTSPADLIGGQSYEAARFAGDLKLGKLALFVEEPPADAPASALVHSLLENFAGWGWATKRIATQDTAAISGALSIALRARKPLLISCRRPSHPPRIAENALSDDVREAWRAAGGRNTTTRRGWLRRLARHAQATDMERGQAGRLPDGWRDLVRAERAELGNVEGPLSPLAASHQLLSAMAGAIPDLTVASPTLVEKNVAVPIAGAGIVEASDFSGRHISFAGAETALPGVLAGLASHGGFTLIAESPAAGADSLPLTLRPLAREGRRMIHSLTEDHGDPAAAAALPLASLRAIPNLLLFRPACAIETAECWELALQRDDGPSVLIHSTQEMPRWRPEGSENACARGGYVAAGVYDARAATLIASGAELAIALEARRLLGETGIAVAVVSLPCWSLFVSQTEAYRTDVLGDAPRIAVEAGSDFGWGRWLGERGQFIGAASIGLTAARPGEYFGVTADALVIAVKKKL